MIALVVLAANIGLAWQGAGAQSLRNADVPAEFPPASYTGKQYVDSRGCVYVRAGIDGNVTWVPRVTRSREVVCGAQPSLANAGAAAAPAAQTRPTARPVQITLDGPSAASAPQPVIRQAPAPQPAPKVVARQPAPASAPASASAPAPAPAPARIVRVPPNPAPVRIVRIEPAPAPAARRTVPARSVVTRTPACQGGSVISNRYINDGSAGPVRCGPQAESPVTVIRRGEVPKPGQKNVYYNSGYLQPTETARLQIASAAQLPPGTRLVPRSSYQPPLPATARIVVPKGYKPTWEDDRLNPHRASQTLEGRRQMLLVWTNDVPRRLVDRASGKVIAVEDPVIYRPVGDSARISTRDRAADGKAQVSTRATIPRQPATAAPAAAKFVQVGLFSTEDKAQAAAGRVQRSGVPVRLGVLHRGGAAYRVVLAGPFLGADAQARGLHAAQRAGYGGAFLRD